MRAWILLGLGVLSMSGYASITPTDEVIDSALSGDAASIDALRREGQAGLDRLLAAHARRPSPTSAAAVDAVAGQRHASRSGLYWHTDLDTARLESMMSGRPILSLRLLGSLAEEHSCANSRFFRAALYSNPEISALLRERYVLHWSSERPAPRMTIDLGDGRQIVRTITGNSAHYILDTQGRPIDILPGMYAPAVFLAQLHDGLTLHGRLDGAAPSQRQSRLSRWHRARQAEALEVLRSVSADPAAATRWVEGGGGAVSKEDMALSAMLRSTSKAFIEMPALEELVPPSDRGEWRPESEDWGSIGARLYADQSLLHPDSVSLIAAQQPLAALPSADTRTGLATMVRRFEADMAADTARNELTLRARARGWLAEGDVGPLSSLNARVYDELFETPASDPWMGLLIEDAYTGLDRGGVR